jgi:hypothetical protein
MQRLTLIIVAFILMGVSPYQRLRPTSPYVILGGLPTPTLVQHIASTLDPLGFSADNGNNYKFTLPNPVLAGNTLICGFTRPSGRAWGATPVQDTNGTWPTTPSCAVTDDNANLDLAIFVLPNASAGIHTITVNLASALNMSFRYVCSEYYNLNTTNPVDGCGSNANIGGTANLAPNLTSGTINMSDNNANGGHLIWSIFEDDNAPGSGNSVTTFAPGSGYALLDADIGWAGRTTDFHATQTKIAATGTSESPTISATMTPANDGFIALSVALKVASAGNAPSAGIHINKILHFTSDDPPNSWIIQAPTTGNLVVALMNEFDVINTSNVTQTAGGTFTKYDNSNAGPQFWSAPNTTPSNSNKITITNTGVATTSLTVFDISGAASSPIGAQAGSALTDLCGTSSVTNWPTITPTQANGVTIAAALLGQGPGLSVTAPSGAIFDLILYTGQTDTSNMDNSDLRGHYYTNSTIVENWAWTFTNIACGTGNSSASTAVHYKQ